MNVDNSRFERAVSLLKEDRNTNLSVIGNLEEENRRLKADTYKDTELSEMKRKYEGLRKAMQFGFPITEEENAAINKWKAEHVQKKHSNTLSRKLIGWIFDYTFTPTSVGVIGVCRCNYCYNKAIEKYCDAIRYEDYSVGEEMRLRDEIVLDSGSEFYFGGGLSEGRNSGESNSEERDTV